MRIIGGRIIGGADVTLEAESEEAPDSAVTRSVKAPPKDPERRMSKWRTANSRSADLTVRKKSQS